ncbi:MAG: ribosome silencing factor [Proteobacteria bacterium]|nr:ribosome silencing factor [Burkholderiales bacterium]
MRIDTMKRAVIDALEDVKAKEIVAFNVTKMTTLCDWVVIASGDSTRQTKALANNVRDKLKEAGAEVLGIEGESVGEWILVDLGKVIVHIMQPAVRSHYNLEELWTPPPRSRRKSALAEPAT